jgi:hypothetical protein
VKLSAVAPGANGGVVFKITSAGTPTTPQGMVLLDFAGLF